MKILHVITLSELGGSQSVILNLSAESIADGHTVMIAASAGGSLWEILPEQALKWPIESLKRDIRTLDDIRAYLELRKIYKVFKPDIVHLHSSKTGFLGRLAFPPKKTIYTVHGFDSLRIAFRQYLPFERILQYRVAHIVTVSKYDYANLLAEGIHKNVKYIYNGVRDFNALAESLNLPNTDTSESFLGKSGHFKVLCIARLAPPKDFELFCEIALCLVNQDIEFYWIGNKEVPKQLPANVHCLGEIGNAHRLLPNAQLSILTSKYEGMPISILEALCYGIPVVASDVGGIREILNGKNGLALANKASIFATHILRYKENPEIYKKAQIQARISYLQHFTIGQMYNSYNNLYKSMLEENLKQRNAWR